MTLCRNMMKLVVTLLIFGAAAGFAQSFRLKEEPAADESKKLNFPFSFGPRKSTFKFPEGRTVIEGSVACKDKGSNSKDKSLPKCEGLPQSLPAEAVLVVQLRDTSLMDAPSVLLKEQRIELGEKSAEVLKDGRLKYKLEIDNRIPPGMLGLSVSARLNLVPPSQPLSGLSKGDWYTTTMHSLFSAVHEEDANGIQWYKLDLAVERI